MIFAEMIANSFDAGPCIPKSHFVGSPGLAQECRQPTKTASATIEHIFWGGLCLFADNALPG